MHGSVKTCAAGGLCTWGRGVFESIGGDEAKRKSRAQCSWLEFALEEYITFLKDEKGEALAKGTGIYLSYA